MRLAGVSHPRTRYLALAAGMLFVGGILGMAVTGAQADDPLTTLTVFGPIAILVLTVVDRWIDVRRAIAVLRRRGVATTASVTAVGVAPVIPDPLRWAIEVTYEAPQSTHSAVFKQRLRGFDRAAPALGDALRVRNDPDHPELVGWVA